MAVPSFQSFLLPLLKLGYTGEIHGGEAVQAMSDQFKLSTDERAATTPSGTTIIKSRTAWAITFLVHAGLLERPKRGYFTITERGKKVVSDNPESINVKFLRQYPEFEKFQSGKNQKPSTQTTEPAEVSDASDVSPEERIYSARDEIIDALESEVLKRILAEPPDFFEKLIIKLLVAMGYGGFQKDAGKHTGKPGDKGIDGVIKEDKLGLDIICIQAKRYTEQSVQGSDIRDFIGSLDIKGTNKGVFVTTSSFSKSALEYANDTRKHIILIDGDKLAKLMVEYNVGVQLDRAVELKKIDEDFFLEE